jgi:hypothetical protein
MISLVKQTPPPGFRLALREPREPEEPNLTPEFRCRSMPNRLISRGNNYRVAVGSQFGNQLEEDPWLVTLIPLLGDTIGSPSAYR